MAIYPPQADAARAVKEPIPGPLVAWILGALEAAVVDGGVGANGADLVKDDKSSLMVNGSIASRAAGGREIVHSRRPAEVGRHAFDEVPARVAR